MTTPDDFGLAATGDLSALRRLRDSLFDVAVGRTASPLLPPEDALAQAELLAVMAEARGETADRMMALALYQVRVETLERDTASAVSSGESALAGGDQQGFDRWVDTIVQCQRRIALYKEHIDARVQETVDESGAEGTAYFVAALTQRADNGDELAPPMIERLLQCVTPAKAQAIGVEVRKIQEGTLQ